MIHYCDSSCDEENGRIAVAYNFCYLEKVTIRKRDAEQSLGISITCLIDGIFTVAEIVREVALFFYLFCCCCLFPAFLSNNKTFSLHSYNSRLLTNAHD